MKSSLIIIVIVIVVILFIKPKITYNKIIGSGNRINEDRPLENFSAIKIIGSIDVNTNYSNDFNCSISGDDNLIPHLTTEVINNELNISIKKNYSTKEGLKVNVYAPNYDEISIKGSGDVNISDFNNDKLSLKIDGSGDITGFGDVQTLTVKINGSGDIMLKELKSKSTKIIINGSGDAKVWASESISAVINGSGDIEYHGDPINVDRKINGSGNISGP